MPEEREREMKGDEVCLVLTSCKTFKDYVSVIQTLICEIAQKMSLKTVEQLLLSLPTTSSGRYCVKRMLNWENVILKSLPHSPLPPFGNSPLTLQFCAMHAFGVDVYP